MGLSQPTVSHHLAPLRIRRMVEARRQGRHVYYRCAQAIASPAPGMLRLSLGGGVVVSIAGL